jgi:hypothetical protein
VHARLDAGGKIDGDRFAIDGTSVRAHRAAAGAGEENRDRQRAA